VSNLVVVVVVAAATNKVLSINSFDPFGSADGVAVDRH